MNDKPPMHVDEDVRAVEQEIDCASTDGAASRPGSGVHEHGDAPDPASSRQARTTGLRRTVSYTIDNVATGLARVFMLSRSRDAPNTLEELRVYQDYSLDELFGVDPEVPEVSIREMPDRRSFHWTELTFPSTHAAVSAPLRQLAQSAYQRNGTVHARWLRHADGAPRSTLIFLHSWMQPVSIFEDVLLLPRFATALGVDVISLQLPYHGRRKPDCAAFHGEYFWTADLVRTFEAMRQSVHDVRTLVGWLAGQDVRPVGVMGVSLGGMVALALACFENRLDFVIPVAAHLDLAGVLEDAGLLVPMRNQLARHGWQPRDVEAYTRGLGLDGLTPCIDRSRLLFVVGSYDRILTTHRSEALWRRWEEPPIHYFDGGHLGILTHMRGTLAVGRTFLEERGLV